MPDSNPRANEIFTLARELRSHDERQAYVDEACGPDDALRHQVEALLAADAPAGNAGEFQPPDAARRVDDGSPPTASLHDPAGAVGTVIAGKYKLIEPIGEGGMGTVFLAQQTTPVKRQVALKLVKAGMDSKAVLARFEAERQALAMMDHPNIARVHDGGVTDTGRPFFVMELVKGVPITRFCDQRKLSPRERLELFVPVCQAIQHAHNKGIIHRDIKPSNVLVALYDDRPVPKVIDFGVAKATGAQLGEHTVVTGFGAMVGTPEYMSPEQAGFNPDVDTRSDVYALGVLLYELLTGTTPVDRKRLGQAAVMEILRVIREEEPARPSTKLSTSEALPSVAANRNIEPAQLTRMLRGELDWVVMKALEKDRSRRYETANGLARDVQRYLADEVVEARPPSTAYRLRKFIRRNRGRVVAAALVLLALVGGMVGTTVGMVQAESARRAAEDARKEAEKQATLAEKRLLQSIDAVSLFARDARIFCEDAMVPALSRQQLYEVLIAQLERNVDEQDAPFDEDKVRNKILMYQQIAQVNADLGGLERLKKAKEWDEKGLKLTEQWVQAKPDDPAARSHRAAYVHLLGVSYQRVGDKAKADAMYKEALDVRQELWNNPDARKQIDKFTPGKSYTNLCDSLDTHHRFEESLRLREEAYQRFGTFELLDAWCWTCWKAGFYAQGYDTKKIHLTKSVDLSAELTEKRPTSRGVQKRWAFVLRDLGELEHNHGHLAEAQKYYTRLVNVTKKLATAPDLARQRQSYARSWYALGRIEKELGQAEEARNHFEQCRLIREELLRDYPDFDTYVHLRIDWLFALVALGEHAQAALVADEIRKTYPTDNNILYRLTCIYSLSIPAVEESRRPKPPTPEDKALQGTYLDKALNALEQSLFRGNREFFNIQVDADLIPIRSDPRYKEILAKYRVK
jgi:serine/threonine protein kinase/tetratricopeptide (TPR) repeat protein